MSAAQPRRQPWAAQPQGQRPARTRGARTLPRTQPGRCFDFSSEDPEQPGFVSCRAGGRGCRGAEPRPPASGVPCLPQGPRAPWQQLDRHWLCQFSYPCGPSGRFSVNWVLPLQASSPGENVRQGAGSAHSKPSARSQGLSLSHGSGQAGGPRKLDCKGPGLAGGTSAGPRGLGLGEPGWLGAPISGWVGPCLQWPPGDPGSWL